MTEVEPDARANVAAEEGDVFGEILVRMARLEKAVARVAEAEPGSAEARCLRKALAESFAVIDSLTDAVMQMRAEIDTMKRKLARYESENMSSSTTSLYNHERGKFRARRGENPAGGPGEKIMSGDGDGPDDDSSGNGVSTAAPENLTKNGKKIGPPIGHRGVSHHNKATLPPMRYAIETTKSQCCGAHLAMLRPACKMVYDLDQHYQVQSVMIVIERAKCAGCSHMLRAETPFLEGTSLGPVLFAVIMILFSKANTDEDIADIIYGMFGFELSGNAIYNARTAISQRLRMGMLAVIMRAIQLHPYIQMDESKYKRGDGAHGYVWVVYTPVAVFVFFSHSRSDTVLEVHFAWLRGKPTTCDGHAGYRKLTNMIQRDFIHILRKAEKVAVTSRDPADEVRYDMLLELYRDVKKVPTLAPFTWMALARRAYSIAASYKAGKIKTHILNAIPDLFTFLAHPGMSPHSNDVEREIKDGIISQRNARHKTVTPGGRALISTLLTFTRTCYMQHLSPGRALLEYLLDGTWNIFERAGGTPYSLANPDGSRYSVFVGLDPPPPRVAAIPAATGAWARQDRTDAAHSMAA
ncbi:MAG: transposase [Nitrosopumilaceae archaeon]|nr:transposase [Nitrosopumilaceae archaeon]